MIGSELRKRRLALRIAQWDVASEAGISQAALSLLEMRNIASQELRERVARALEHLEQRQVAVA